MYTLLKYYIDLGLHLFFIKVEVINKHNIPKNTPVLFVANHQNALIDALLIVTQNPRITYFVARADAFKSKLIARFLWHLKMMPIYRIRDGRQSLQLNEQIFEQCEKILSIGHALTIFPEGNHSLKRRLRPLSKGFTRIVFKTLENHPTLNLKIVPVGLNYTDHTAYRGSVSVIYGEPISKEEYLQEDLQESTKALRQLVTKRMKMLITHVEDEIHYDEIIEKLENQNVNYLNPDETNQKIAELGQSVESKSTEKIRIPWLIYWPAVLNTIIPLLLWQMIKAKIKDPVMETTFKFCFGIVAFPLFYLLQAVVLAQFYNATIGLIYFAVSIFMTPLIAMRKWQL